MRKKLTLASYLDELRRNMQMKGTFDPDTFAEIESHLLESIDQGVHRGLTPKKLNRMPLSVLVQFKLFPPSLKQEGHPPCKEYYWLLPCFLVS